MSLMFRLSLLTKDSYLKTSDTTIQESRWHKLYDLLQYFYLE